MRKLRKFEKWELQWLKANSRDFTIRDMAEFLDRAEATVHAKIHDLGLQSSGWTGDNVKQLIDRLFEGSEWNRLYADLTYPGCK